MSAKSRIKVEEFRPLRNTVFVTDLERGPGKTAGGIIIPDDNVTERGIRARWGKVYAVGPEVTDIVPGQWVLTSHGRWTERMTLSMESGDVTVWRIEYPEASLLVSDTDPFSVTPTALPDQTH